MNVVRMIANTANRFLMRFAFIIPLSTRFTAFLFRLACIPHISRKNLTILNANDTICHPRYLLIMGDHKDCLVELMTKRLHQQNHVHTCFRVQVSRRYCVVSRNDSFVQFCFSLAPIGARSGLCKRQIAQKRGPNRELLPARSSFAFSSYFFR